MRAGVVVSDASPIRALHHLGLLRICEQLYGDVLVPETVRQELLRPTSTCPAIDIALIHGFEVRAARDAPGALGVPDDLDAGETEAITLALEEHARLLLMDERKATAVARGMGLNTVGVLGVLIEARMKQMVPAVLPLVDRLVTELHFFVMAGVRRRIAELAGEQG